MTIHFRFLVILIIAVLFFVYSKDSNKQKLKNCFSTSPSKFEDCQTVIINNHLKCCYFSFKNFSNCSVVDTLTWKMIEENIDSIKDELNKTWNLGEEDYLKVQCDLSVRLYESNLIIKPNLILYIIFLLIL